MRKTVYKSDMAQLNLACRAAMMAIESVGTPIVLANVYKHLEQVVALATSLDAVGDQLCVSDADSEAYEIKGMVSGHVNGERVTLLPAGRHVLILADVDDLLVPLSVAACWRHSWLSSLYDFRDDLLSVEFVSDSGEKWVLSWGDWFSPDGIGKVFGPIAAARMRKDRDPIVLQRVGYEET